MALFHTVLRRLIRQGTLTLHEADGSTHVFGSPHPDFPDLVIRTADRRAGFDIVRSPRLGFAEAYMDGRLIVERGDIMELVGLIRGNNPWESGRSIEPKGPFRRGTAALTRRARQLNHRAQARRNVAHHYDLSGRLYDLFLDRDRQYSCAYFTDLGNGARATLEQAQDDKKAHIAAKLNLKPGQRVLDIGCGWGGMALYLHAKTGVDVLGITLSEEQYKVACERAASAGVSDHVRFELVDYRDVQGRFDRIVSVGMFEHVGAPNYREFYRLCHNLLTEDGVMLLHTIGRMGKPAPIDGFTRKYIFPGGHIPALSEMVTASEPNKLAVSDVEVLRLHYAYTLRAWYRRTVANREAIEALYDARFFRMWTLYLSGATAAFEHGGMVNFQIQYVRSRHALPITRDYMAEAEAGFRT